jgi:hypothetical protein
MLTYLAAARPSGCLRANWSAVGPDVAQLPRTIPVMPTTAPMDKSRSPDARDRSTKLCALWRFFRRVPDGTADEHRAILSYAPMNGA